jgi:hypothetical protein
VARRSAGVIPTGDRARRQRPPHAAPGSATAPPVRPRPARRLIPVRPVRAAAPMAPVRRWPTALPVRTATPVPRVMFARVGSAWPAVPCPLAPPVAAAPSAAGAAASVAVAAATPPVPAPPPPRSVVLTIPVAPAPAAASARVGRSVCSMAPATSVMSAVPVAIRSPVGPPCKPPSRRGGRTTSVRGPTGRLPGEASNRRSPG